jgi:hypothetical protein
MNTAAKALLSALDTLQGRAGFSSAGATPFFFPDLTVEDIGEIAFPLSAQQASAFTRLAEAAPYGKGTKTKHDESVRKCWQLDAKHFSFKAKAWSQYLKATLAKISSDLGITGKISAKPYKLLLYGPGGHFKAHRDTEKLNAMFGTLIVALPSRHEGGQLHIRHGGEQVTVDFSAETHHHDFQHAAFFADCEHEVVPVKSGYRFCVVFNLVLEEGDPASLNVTADDHAGPLAALLKKVALGQDIGNPTVILLQHQYTEANFSLRKLKGGDRQRAAALFAAAGKAGLTARLALATLYQMGELEDGYDYGSRNHRSSRGHDDPEKGTMGEVYEESLELGHWRDAGDRKVTMGAFLVSLEEVITAEDFSKTDPDEKAGEGYTGNAGCTMEYWYRRAAVVLWPEGCEEEIHCARNMADACESLLGMSTGKKTGPGSPFDKLAQAAIRVMVSQDDSAHHPYRHLDTEIRLPVTRLASALARAKRGDLVEKLANELPPPRLAVCPPAVWRQLFAVCAPETFAAIFRHWLKSPEDFRKPLFAALGGLCAKRSQDLWVVRIAAALARLKPVEISKWEAQKSRDPIPPGDLDESRILLAATNRLSHRTDIAAATGFLRSDGSLFAVRKLIGPLFTGSVRNALLAESAVAVELLTFCKDALAAEIARPLLPYPDWRRPCPPVPKEGYPHHYGRKDPPMPVLEELAAFMADPAMKELAIRRREDQRMVAEEFIRTHFLDLDCKTLRQGTPHTLLCTKNDRSHQHEREWRKKDEIMLRELQKC